MPTLSRYTADLTLEQRSLAFIKWLGCFHDTRGDALAATERFKHRWPGLHHDVITKAISQLEMKEAVLPGDTVTPSWAGGLVTPKPFADAFVALARSASLLGRLPGLRTAPFGVQVPVQTSGASYRWVKQGDPKPVSTFALAGGVLLTATKASAILVTTKELATLAAPGAAEALRDDLVAGLTEFVDQSFLDPSSGAVADTSPASVTFGTVAVPGTGDPVVDVKTLLTAFYAAAPGAEAVLVMGGGPRSELTGVNTPAEPIIVSGAAGALGIIVALDPRRIVVADDGVVVDRSEHAALRLDSAPTAATVVTDLWGTNLVGLRVERTVNWSAAPNAVQYLTLA
jgi:hypothetical protein